MHPRAVEFREQAAAEHGIEVEIEEFPEGTKTAAEAANAVGCEVAQIASSLVFLADGELVVVVTSGANRVDEGKVADALGADKGGCSPLPVIADPHGRSPANSYNRPYESVAMADAGTIKGTLGWSIGGVPPICHGTDVPVLLDATLREFGTVWAAAGTPEAVFPADPNTLIGVSNATVWDVAAD